MSEARARSSRSQADAGACVVTSSSPTQRLHHDTGDNETRTSMTTPVNRPSIARRLAAILSIALVVAVAIATLVLARAVNSS
jgi:hypothetical protein